MTAPAASIQFAETEQDILRCFPVLQELRTHLQLESFLPDIRRQQADGYFLAMLEIGKKVVAVAGCRFGENLARGKFLYVDDFVTGASFHRQGYGRQLFDWLVKLAEISGCRQLHLDSGVQRTGAHQFYEARGMRFTSRHYSQVLRPA